MNSGIEADTSIIILIDIVMRLFNYAIVFASGVFALFIIYAGIKLAMSLGDPKGVQSAKQTLIYAFLGFLVVMIFFTVIRLIFSVVGIDLGFANPTAPFSQLQEAIENFDNIIRR